MSGKLVMGAVLGLVVGVGAGWLVGGSGSTGDAGAAEQLAEVERERDAVADAKAAAETELESVKLRVARLDRELSSARASLAAAEAQAAELAAVAAAADASDVAEHADIGAVDQSGASGLGVGQTFSFPEYDEHLADVNWTEVGGHVGAMAPLLSEIFEAVSKNQQPSPEAIGGIQQHNGPLVTVAMKFKDKLPGETVNGAFSHPSAVVNLIASTLDAMGKPLSDEQHAAMERVGNEFVAEDRRRLQSYGEDALALRRHADESLLKGRFYAAAMNVLTTEQHEMLRPVAVRGRVTADLFSPSLVWVGRARPVPFTDRADLAELLSERIGRDLRLESEPRDRMTATVSQWAADLPDEMMTREPDSLWLKGLVPIDAIDLAAKHQIVLMERIILDVDLSDEAVGELRTHNAVFVPTWRPEQ